MKPILVIDIETTGFLRDGGKIVEIGAVALDLETGGTKVVFNEICHEDGITREEVQNSWIVKNSTLTLEEVRRSTNFKEIQEGLQQLIDFYKLGATAYNNAFDFGFLEDRGIVFPKKLPCPMLLATDVCKLPGRYAGQYKWPKVQECFDFLFPINNYVEQHRGADDALHEAQIIHKLYELGIFKI